MTRRWMLSSRRISEVVVAEDQRAAWNTLRHRPVEDFGLIVTAEPDEDGDPIPVHTSGLMFLWGRDDDARLFIQAAIDEGLGDSTVGDMRFAGRSLS